jgi:hypothetical protein
MNNLIYSTRVAKFNTSSQKKIEQSAEVNDNVAEYIDLALKHRLYVPGWLLKDIMLLHKNKIQQKAFSIKKDNVYYVNIGLCFLNDIPIANHFQFGSVKKNGLGNVLYCHSFVRKAYRRNKIATNLFMLLQEKNNEDISKENIYFSASTGIKNSHLYWDNIGVGYDYF